ncbi:MAG: sigma 54-interacting transcriptional regulator, partial [Planctomycetota bacterium]|nr:sigma 54-interacting transcriptional regulator [Planctomycetota bacterium]
RIFQRLGETEDRRFQGKIIAATNRDLADEMRTGRFRKDFYYRLCSDQIHTVPLSEQLANSPGGLDSLIHFIAKRIAGDEAAAVAKECHQWIAKHLAEYHWPGNIRDLEQCLRNIMIRGQYWPRSAVEAAQPTDSSKQWLFNAEQCHCTADELISQYCRWAYDKLGTYDAAAKRLGLDRRTVRSKVGELGKSASPL